MAGAPSPPTTWWSPRAPTTPSGCCTGCATTASSRGSPRASATTRGPTPSRSSAPCRPRKDTDFTRGVAITSSFLPDAHTHIEPVRYGKGSNLMGLLGTVLTDGVDGRAALEGVGQGDRRRPEDRRALAVRTPMVRARRDRPGHAVGRQLAHGPRGAGPARPPASPRRRATASPTPPGSRRATRRRAPHRGEDRRLPDGPARRPDRRADDRALRRRRAASARTPSTASIDGYHRVFGHDGLHVVDGSAVSANLGVNPSLTITAQAERAMSLVAQQGRARPPSAAGLHLCRGAARGPARTSGPRGRPRRAAARRRAGHRLTSDGSDRGHGVSRRRPSLRHAPRGRGRGSGRCRRSE